MTPSMPLPQTITQPASPPPAYKDTAKAARDTSRDASRETSRDTKASSSEEASSKSRLTENKNDTAEAGSTLFDELMASLLNMPAPAQPQPTVTVKPVANDSFTVSATAASSTPAAPQFGVAFNMDPALLVLPQDVNATNLSSQTSSFSAELLAALTPGVPATEVAAAPVVSTETVTVTVPVPVLPATEAANTTPALTVPAADVQADPRLVACGLDPAQMQVLKDKLAATTNPAPPSSSQNAPAPVQAQNSTPVQTPAPTQSNDKGVITVTMGLDTSPQVPVQVKVQQSQQQIQQPVPVTTPVAMTSEVAETIATVTQPTETSDTTLDPASLADTGSETTSTATDTSYDPVEFRIAQRFQRPVSTPAASATPADNAATQSNAPANNQAPGAAINPKADNQAGHAAIKGKVDITAGSALPTTTTAITTPVSFDSLTVAPSSLPVTVSPLTSTVAQGTTAAQSHPAIQTVAAVIAKGAKTEGPQTISLRLDPPELGKLQVEMKYKKGDPLKVHVVLEKADTAAMFQRDAHALQSALNDAGLQLDGSSLSFEFSQDGNNFKQAMGQDSAPQNQSSHWSESQQLSEAAPIESSMNIFTDSKTGITHYNLKV